MLCELEAANDRWQMVISPFPAFIGRLESEEVRKANESIGALGTCYNVTTAISSFCVETAALLPEL